jgi:hypothetical protein
VVHRGRDADPSDGDVTYSNFLARKPLVEVAPGGMETLGAG